MGMDMELIRENDDTSVVIAEWRKFFPLHNWIDQHIPTKVNAMFEYIPISKDIMDNLLSDINYVLEDHKKAPSIFDGWNDSFDNDFYFNQLQYTKNMLELCLQDKYGIYFYHSYI